MFKKTALAIAVLGSAVAPAAIAQVSVSGVLDVGYASRATAASVTNSAVIGSGVVATPTITFSGSEDIGGGLKASFNISQEFNAATGEIDDRDTGGDNSPQFQTLSVSLAGAFGQFDIGTFAHATRDAGGVYRFFGNIGRLAADTTVTSFNTADTVENSVQYRSPSINGFQVTLGKGDAGKQTTTLNSASLTTMGLSGSVADLRLNLARDSAKTAAGVKTVLSTYAGSYDLKVLKAGFVYAESKADADDKKTAMGAHVAVPAGRGITVGGSYTQYKDSATNGDKSNVVALAAQYDLSKRTAVYATWQQIANSGSATLADSTRGLGVQEIVGKTTNGSAITIVHKF